MDDEKLVELCKKGDTQAFEQLVQIYYLPLQRFFYKHLYDSKVCEDLTHDVVLKLIKNIDKYRPVFNTKFSTWLFKIAYNTYLDYVRKRPSASEVDFEEAGAVIGCDCDVHDKVVQRMDVLNIKKMVNSLPEEMKSLIILRYFKDFSYSDIGKIMSMGTNTVRWKLHNSMERLKKMLKTSEGGV